MNTVAQAVHIFRKDVRRFWPLLVLLVAVLAASAFSGPGGSLQHLLGRIPLIWAGGAALLLSIFAAVVMQEDAPEGGQAFWVTRPISPAAMLLAKASFIGLFLFVLPLSVQSLQVAGLISTAPLIQLVAESALAYGALLVLVCLAASLTTDLKSLILFLIFGALGLGILGAILSTGNTGLDDFYSGERMTWALLRNIIVIMVGAALVAHQFLTRDRNRTLTFGVLAFIVTTLIGNVSTLDWSRDALDPTVRRQAENPEGYTLELVGLSHQPGGQGRVPSGMEGIEADFRLETPGQLLARETSVMVRLLGPGLEKFIRPEYSSSSGDLGRASRELEGLKWLGGSPSRDPTFLHMTTIIAPAGELEGIRSQARDLEVSADFDVFRPKILARLPLRRGEAVSTPVGRFSLSELTIAKHAVALEVSRSWVASTLEKDVRGFFGWSETTLALVNSQRGEIFPAGGGSGGSGSGGTLFLPGPRFKSRTTSVDFNEGTQGSSQPTTLDPEWIAGAELVIIATEYVGSIEKEILTLDIDWPENFQSWRKERTPKNVRPNR